MTEQNRSETLSNGDQPPRTTNRKTLILAASALVAVLAAGGVGYALANRSDAPAAQANQTTTSATPPENRAATDGDPKNGDVTNGDATNGDATNGDVTNGDPQSGTPTDGTSQDPRQSTQPTGKPTADTGSAGKNSHTAKPTTPAQDDPADNPADGPAGELAGQCSKSGC